MTNNRWHLVPAAALTTAAALSGSIFQNAAAQSGPIWSHESGSGAENWNARVVAIGDHGTQVLTSFGPYTDFTRLFSAFDQSPPSPVWQDDSTVTTQRHRVSSAKEADVHVTLHDVDSGSVWNTRNVLVHKYTSASADPDWSYTFPEVTNGHEATSVHVSQDGQRIVALMYNIYQNETDVVVFGPDSGVPTNTFHLSLTTPMVASILSADGSTLYVRSSTRLKLLDLNTGSMRYEDLVIGGTAYSDALSGDGSIFAYSTYNDVKVYREIAGQFGTPEIISLPGENYCGSLAISADNRVLALGFNYYSDWLRVRLQARDIETGALLVDDELVGTGSLQNLISAVRLSANGTRLAAGLWGDEGGLVPEVVVYSTQNGDRIAEFEVPGSVNTIDFAADGSKLAVASKKTHANVVASGGRIDLYHIGADDFVMEGVPRVGSNVTFTFRARAGKTATLFEAPALSTAPTTIPGVGTLRLDQSQTTSIPLGVVGADDSITADFTIPNDVSLVGKTLYFQGFASSPRTLSRGWVAVTILP